MRSRQVSAARPLVVWVAAIIVLALVAGLVLTLAVFLPERRARQAADRVAAQIEAQLEQHYQAGMAFQALDDWAAAEAEYKQVISLDAGYKDAQLRLAEVKATSAEGAAASTATAAAQVVVAQANAAATALAVQATAVAAPSATAVALDALYQRALGLINLQQWPEAQVEMRQVFDLDPNYKDVQAQLALINAEVAKLTPTATSTPRIPATPAATATPAAYFVDEFDDPAIDASKWEIVGGLIAVRDGKVILQSSGPSFPFVCAKENPIPLEGDFHVNVKLRYPAVTNKGVGLGLDNAAGQTLFSVWQDDAGWSVRWGVERLRVHSLPAPQSGEHVLELKCVGTKYYIYVDQALVYTSAGTTERPSMLWFGHSPGSYGEGAWTSLEIDHIVVTTLP